MLGKLFGSNSRVKILKLFLLHPEKRYYIRQIARDLKLQVNSVRRELENLEKFGLLVSRLSKSNEAKQIPAEQITRVKDDNGEMYLDLSSSKEEPEAYEAASGASKQEKKFYQVDVNFVLYEEIRALVIKAQILYEKDFVDKIQNLGRIKALVLSGVFVNNASAPVDILLVGKINKDKFLKVIKELENELGREVNFCILSPSEFSYRRDMTDIFLYEVLENKKIVVINELGF